MGLALLTGGRFYDLLHISGTILKANVQLYKYSHWRKRKKGITRRNIEKSAYTQPLNAGLLLTCKTKFNSETAYTSGQ
jgi:hypothetical protein